MERKLKEWGLTLDDAISLGWEEVDPLQVEGLPQLRCIRIPYYEPTDLSRRTRAINGQDFERFRVLPHKLAPPGATLAEDMPRYLQKPGTGCEAYYPPIIDWESVLVDTSIGVIVTEGEAKAAKACKEGFPTIGLGGVSSFRSIRNGIIFSRTLKDFNWRGRRVYIIYDSDIVTNINVVHAINSLALTLVDHGAIPYVCFIPQLENGKSGLDDFLIINGPNMLEQLLTNATPISAVESLIELNNRYVVIKNIAGIYDLENEKITSRNNFVSVIESTSKCIRYKVNAGGKIVPEIISAAQEWLSWPMRSEATKLVYEPGKERYVNNALNIWPGWGCSPRVGDAKLFIELLDYMFGSRQADKEWFLKWLAYPIQNPGTKLFTAAVLYSVEHGTGKSFLGQIIGKIYGKNYGEIQSADFRRDFNAWAENKQFILGDEITSSDKRVESDYLKRLITANELRVNKKYVEEFTIRDCINYMFTTNHPDAFFLEDTDRRFFIHEITERKLSDTFFSELHNWVWEERGYEVVLEYLLNIDCTDFNPRSRAKETISKTIMFEAGLGDLASWVRSLIRDPSSKLMHNGFAVQKDIYTAKELLRIYDPMGQTKVTSNGMTRELAKAGAAMLLRGDRVPTPEGNERVYAIRNAAQWQLAKPHLIIEHINKIKLGERSKF